MSTSINYFYIYFILSREELTLSDFYRQLLGKYFAVKNYYYLLNVVKICLILQTIIRQWMLCICENV